MKPLCQSALAGGLTALTLTAVNGALLFRPLFNRAVDRIGRRIFKDPYHEMGGDAVGRDERQGVISCSG